MRIRWAAAAGIAALAASIPALAPPRHLIYLHGRIVQQQQSDRPRHPEFGVYDLEGILAALRGKGFEVSGEIRPREASVSDSADRVVAQIRKLIASGVPADHVAVVGASMGASIALLASARLQNPDVRFGVLGACLSESVAGLAAGEGKGPIGRVLAIREASDEATASCAPWDGEPRSGPPLAAREIVLRTGLDHGFLYRPIPEWVDPVAEWAAGAPGAAGTVRFLDSGKVLPSSLPLSEAVRVGDMLYLSGQLGLAPGTLKLVPGGIRAEARQTMENIRTILEAHGSSLRDVVKCTVMLADMNEWGAFNEVYRDFFADRYPARSAFGASGLAMGARVEVECIAAAGG
jgi:2-iminobutanoate/2-iminopropanoate deaminase